MQNVLSKTRAFFKIIIFAGVGCVVGFAGFSAHAQITPTSDFVVENIELRADNSVAYDVKNTGDTTKPAGIALTVNHEWLKNDGVALNSRARPQAHIMREIQPGSVVHYDSRNSYPADQIAQSGTFLNFRPADAQQLRLTLDVGNVIAENSESNNVFFLSVPGSLLPDLTVENFFYTNGRLTFTIKNNGEGDLANRATGGVMGFSVNHKWLDQNGAVLTPSGFGGNTFGYIRLYGSGVQPQTSPLYFQNFNAGASVNVDSAVAGHSTLAQYVAAAPRFAARLVVELDSDRSNVESNEDNNMAIFNLAPPQFPDFVIENPSYDGDVSIRLTVRNQGEGPAESFGTRGSLGYTDRANDPYYQLYVTFDWLDAQGNALPVYAAARRVLITNPFPPGDSVQINTAEHPEVLSFLRGFRPRNASKLRVTLEPQSHETNSENNQHTLDIPLPNFVVTGAAFSNGVLTYTLTNQGGGYNSEKAVSVMYEWLKPDGSAANDGANQYDNSFAMAVVPRGEILSAGSAVQFNSQPVGQNHYNYTSDGQRVLLFEFLRRKPPGASQLLIRVQPPYVDASGAMVYEIPESNREDNNTPVALALPDLYVDSVTVGADAVVLGLGNSGAISVSDTGDPSAANNTGFSYEFQWLNAIGEALTPSQGAAQTQTYGFYKTMSPGVVVFMRGLQDGYPEAFDGATFREIVVDNRPLAARTLRVVVDSRNTFAELDETNNTFTFELPFPDLVVSSASLMLEEVFDEFFNRTRQYLDFTYTVTNQGGERTHLSFIPVVFQWITAAGEPLGLPYAFELGSLAHSNAVSEMLFQGRSIARSERFLTAETVVGSDEVQFFANKPAEAGALRIIVDPVDVHDESNENNNSFDVFLITSETTAEELVALDEDVDAEDLEVDEPVVLPGSALYPAERAGEFLKMLFTFNTEKKARLKERYASEKIIEIKKLAQKGKLDKAFKHLKRYENDVSDVKEMLKKVEEEDPVAGKTLALVAFTKQLKHQKVLGTLEADVTPEESVIVKQVRARVIADVSATLNSATTEEVQRATRDAFSDGGSPFKDMRDLEVLKLAEAHAPENIQASLQAAAEQSAQRAAIKFAGVGKANAKLLDDYMRFVGGDEATYLKVFDSVKNDVRSEHSLDLLNGAYDRMITRLGDKVERVLERQPENVEDLFLNLRNGTIADVRVIKGVVDSVDPSVVASVDTVEKDVTEKFKDRLKNLKTPEEQQKYFDMSLRDVSDIKQIQVLGEIGDSLPPEERSVFNSFKNKTIINIREQLEYAPPDKPAKDADADAALNKQVLVRTLLGDAQDKDATIDDARPGLGVNAFNALKNVRDAQEEKQKQQEEEARRKDEALKRAQEDDKRAAQDLERRHAEEKSKQQALDEQKTKDQEDQEDQENAKRLEDQKRADEDLKRKQEEEKRAREEQQKRDEEARKQAVATVCAGDPWECTPWSVCFPDGLKIRTCDPKPGCEAHAVSKPTLEEQCVPLCKALFWECSNWVNCTANLGDAKNGTETRTCKQTVKCEGGVTPPVEARWCQPPAPAVTYPNAADITINSEGFVFPSQLDIAAGGTLLVHNYHGESHGVRFSFESTDRTIGRNSLDNKIALPATAKTYFMYLDGSQTSSVTIVAH